MKLSKDQPQELEEESKVDLDDDMACIENSHVKLVQEMV
jgi:hypothetical protein